MINATREAPMIRGMVVSEGVGVSKDIVFPSTHAFAGTDMVKVG